MGKKEKKEKKKKGRGMEKTAMKTEKKLTAKQKKQLAEMGEEDIENILAQIEEEERKRTEIKEIMIDKPGRRANFTFVAHPLKDELLLFGGEFFNGQKTAVYNDLISYNIEKNTWTAVRAPGAPPPRCGHQMVALPREGGQLWVFGGEFASSSESQFHHYGDLWVFRVGERRWERVSRAGGPSARSGHRMVHVKNRLIVFGGYHDNLREYKYFNDVHAFDLGTYTWSKLEPAGAPPSPRSGCQMVASSDGKVLIIGGYSKERVKKDVDMGIVHGDMFVLSPEKNDATGTKWKWVSAKQGGLSPSPRSGCSIAVGPGNKAYAFGGVFDEEESEEDISGTFFNELNVLDLEKRTWRQVVLSGKKEGTGMRKRRKVEEKEGKEEEEEEMGEAEAKEEEVVQVTDGVFTLTVGPQRAGPREGPRGDGVCEAGPERGKAFWPSPRMNCGLAVKSGNLYLYGGLVEDDEKQFTLADMYSLDLHKLDEWRTILSDCEASKEWIPSESESEGESSECEEETKVSDEEDMDID